jgi:hypothetical protein
MLMREIRGDIENQPNVCGSNITFLGGQSVINFVCFCGICEAPPVGARNRRRSDARFDRVTSYPFFAPLRRN